MFGQILNELAQIESWMSDIIQGHETHDPMVCPGAAMYQEMAVLREDTDDSATAVVVFGLVELLRRTKSPAKVGEMVITKVRKLCALMAQDRITRSRMAAGAKDLGHPTKVDRVYNMPN